LAIPDFQTIMRPELAMLADDQDHTLKEIRNVNLAIPPDNEPVATTRSSRFSTDRRRASR
jgi:hypothetical protein